MGLFTSLVAAVYRRDNRRRIRRHGWTGIYVGDYHSIPTWAYTIGFDETLNQPEIVVFDIPRKGASELLWTTFERLKSGELVLEDGALLDPTDPMPFTWRKVHPSQVAELEWLTLAKWRRFERTGQAVGLEAFQMVLPDGEGRLPWQEGYDERLRPRQPALWLPFESGEPPLAASSGV